jgi:hypothetical protein
MRSCGKQKTKQCGAVKPCPRLYAQTPCVSCADRVGPADGSARPPASPVSTSTRSGTPPASTSATELACATESAACRVATAEPPPLLVGLLLLVPAVRLLGATRASSSNSRCCLHAEAV